MSYPPSPTCVCGHSEDHHSGNGNCWECSCPDFILDLTNNRGHRMYFCTCGHLSMDHLNGQCKMCKCTTFTSKAIAESPKSPMCLCGHTSDYHPMGFCRGTIGGDDKSMCTCDKFRPNNQLVLLENSYKAEVSRYFGARCRVLKNIKMDFGKSFIPGDMVTIREIVAEPFSKAQSGRRYSIIFKEHCTLCDHAQHSTHKFITVLKPEEYFDVSVNHTAVPTSEVIKMLQSIAICFGVDFDVSKRLRKKETFSCVDMNGITWDMEVSYMVHCSEYRWEIKRKGQYSSQSYFLWEPEDPTKPITRNGSLWAYDIEGLQALALSFLSRGKEIRTKSEQLKELQEKVFNLASTGKYCSGSNSGVNVLVN